MPKKTGQKKMQRGGAAKPKSKEAELGNSLIKDKKYSEAVKLYNGDFAKMAKELELTTGFLMKYGHHYKDFKKMYIDDLPSASNDFILTFFEKMPLEEYLFVLSEYGRGIPYEGFRKLILGGRVNFYKDVMRIYFPPEGKDDLKKYASLINMLQGKEKVKALKRVKQIDSALSEDGKKYKLADYL